MAVLSWAREMLGAEPPPCHHTPQNPYSFHFIFHYPYITPILYPHKTLYNPYSFHFIFHLNGRVKGPCVESFFGLLGAFGFQVEDMGV